MNMRNEMEKWIIGVFGSGTGVIAQLIEKMRR
jgi:hypothetical protein